MTEAGSEDHRRLLGIQNKRFTEYSETGGKIQLIVETMLIGIGEHFDIHYGMPTHDVARRFLNEIFEFESEREQDQRIMEEAKKGEGMNANKSGG